MSRSTPIAPPGASQPVEAYRQAVRQEMPQWLGPCLDAALERLERARQGALQPGERTALAEVLAVLQSQRQAWTQRLVAAVMQAVDDDLVEAVPATPHDEPELALSLLDEDTIDEDIALSRLVQVAELEADAALRELAARCSRMRGLASVSPDANPMRPAVVAGALRRAVGDAGLKAPQRVLLLRELGIAIGSRLAAVYAAQLELLTGWGVEPTRFRLRLSLGDFGAPPSTPAPAAPPVHPPARAPAHANAAANVRSVAGEALRRLGVGQPDVEAEPPAEVMARLLTVLLSRSTLTDGSRAMIRRLDAPARQLAAHEPDIWRSPDHPLWQLLDRLVSAGSVDDALDTTHPGPLGAALESAVQRLEAANPPDAEDCRQALATVDHVATDLLGLQVERVAPQAERMHAQVARDDIEIRLRAQIVQQVRGNTVPPALRQFLVGPWASALAHSAQLHGEASVQVQLQAELVDEMIAACTRPPGQALMSKVFTRCVTHARLGLMEAGLPAQRIDAEVADLERVLRSPWGQPGATTPDADGAKGSSNAVARSLPSPPTPPFAPTEPMVEAGEPPDSRPLGLHDALATVPIEMTDVEDQELQRAAHDATEAWLDGLETGVLCRMFMLGRWMNTQLVWRSRNHSMFVFSSRHGGRSHSLSRVALRRLRAAGLAATIERGQFVAQALSELAGAH